MAKEAFKVCARYTGELHFNDKVYGRFVVVGTGTLFHIPIDRFEGNPPVKGSFWLVDVYPRHSGNENYLQFYVRAELTLPNYAETLA